MISVVVIMTSEGSVGKVVPLFRVSGLQTGINLM